MARKLKHVESLCLDKPNKRIVQNPKAVTKHSQTNCLDSDGFSRKNGELWDKDMCTECNCQVRNLQYKYICNFIVIDNDCCRI